MIRSAARPVTNVSPTSSTRSARVTTRKMADAAKSTRLGALRHAAVDAGLDQDRAGQAGQRVEDDQDQAEQQRPAELAQQPAQVEAAVVARLLVEVDGRRRRVPGAGRPPGPAARGSAPGSSRQLPPPPPAQAGADARRAEARCGDRCAAPSAGRPVGAAGCQAEAVVPSRAAGRPTRRAPRSGRPTASARSSSRPESRVR